MKRIIVLIVILIIISSSLSMSYGAESKYLRAKFTETNIGGTSLKQITITPYRYDGEIIEDDEETTYSIYLPSGYLVEGKTAVYVADRDGEYPFTVYYGTTKKTFVYKADGIDKKLDSDTENEKDFNIGSLNYQLMYDYEKKQILFNMCLDKLRNVTTPKGTILTNEVNYYIEELKNNVPFDLTFKVDDESFDYKIIKSGEFYLLLYLSPVNYNDYSSLVEYHGYNFTNNVYYEAFPSKDIYDDNGNYEVLVKSENSKHLFSFNITGIDYRRPDVDIEIIDNLTFDLEVEDDYEIDYVITFDGQYVPVRTGSTFSYSHKTEIKYNGEYIFTVVDKEGNRTVETYKVTSKRKVRKHDIDLDVHDFKYTEDLFENIGLKYDNPDEDIQYFENILPGYMNGTSIEYFNPDAPISRAEMITIFCRLNNLPYDTNAHLKSKFTDIDYHWARDYISMGSTKKYVSGYKDKTFKPDNNVTRAEFCQMLTKISTYKTLLNNIPSSSNYNFTDINGHWAEKEIIRIASKNLVAGETYKFQPDKAITRGEVVHAINILYGINPSIIELAHINGLYTKYYNYQDIDTHEYYFDIIVSVVGMYRENINMGR